MGAAYGGLYTQIVTEIDRLSLAPYQLETYRKKSEIRDEQEHEWETGREVALVGIFKTRFLKRLESSDWPCVARSAFRTRGRQT